MKYTFVENMNSENLLDCEPPAALKLLMLQTSRPKHSFYYFKVKYSYFWFPIISFWSSKNETPNPKKRRREGRWRIYIRDIYPRYYICLKFDIFLKFIFSSNLIFLSNLTFLSNLKLLSNVTFFSNYMLTLKQFSDLIL